MCSSYASDKYANDFINAKRHTREKPQSRSARRVQQNMKMYITLKQEEVFLKGAGFSLHFRLRAIHTKT